MSLPRFEGLQVHALFASSMYCNRRSLVFYDVVILLVIILLVSVMMNGCGFSHWSYQVFHLPYVAAMGVHLSFPLRKRVRDAPDAVTRRSVLNL